LTRLVSVDGLKASGQVIDVIPDETERENLARFLGLASIERLRGRYKVTRNGDRASLKGEIEAELHPVCIVTLEPFPFRLREPVSLKFATAADIEKMAARLMAKAEEGEIDLSPLLDSEDLPEVIVDGTIDLGAATTEFLSLALPPYPRKPGASFDPPPDAGENESPFAALLRLRPKQQ
jgi:uncharacterized metal-binding protein YceD (DUF177 family)